MTFNFWNLGFTNYLFWNWKEEGNTQRPHRPEGLSRAAKFFAILLMFLLVILFVLVEREMKASETPPARTAAPDPALITLPAKEKIELTYYTVKSGDTFPKIAQRCYGDSKQWRKILEANLHVVSSPAQLYSGVRLYIPPQDPLQNLKKESK